MENLDLNVFPTRILMGRKSGEDVEKKIIDLLKKKDTIRMMFAAAPSQNELLDYLKTSNKIAWERIVAFHMDEYIGLPSNSSQAFSSYLNNKIFGKVSFKEVHIIYGDRSVELEIDRYTKLINQAPIDIVCLGIGENGHIAFNEPAVADFDDSKDVKMVELDDICRKQQVNEKCFNRLEDVPKKAITITIPTIMKADYLFCVVAGKNKKEAVYNALNGPITTSCPASILREHKKCRFYFDNEAYSIDKK